MLRGCRFSSTHTTRGHRCGTCGEMGHGVMECGTAIRIDNLKKYFGEQLPPDKHCTGEHEDAWDSFFHSDECHICVRCGERHLETDCYIQNVIELGDRFKQYHEHLDYSDMIIHAKRQNRDQVYKVYVGMGCFLYYKVPVNATTRYDILVFFVHSDSWGQYGEETSDVPKLDRFIGDSEINEDLAERIDANNLVAAEVASEDQGYGITNDGGDVAVGFDYNVAFDSDNDSDNDNEVGYNASNTKQCPICRTENRNCRRKENLRIK